MPNSHDGGAAFPSPTGNQSQNGCVSVRDYFAAKALVAIMPTAASPCLILNEADCDLFAGTAYDLADAMMRARAAKSPREAQDAHLSTFGATEEGQ